MNSTNNIKHFIRKRAAIRVAKNNPCRATLIGRTNTIKRKTRIIFVTIKEMFAIKHWLAATISGGDQRLTDHFQIFIKRCVQCSFYMEIPCFSDKARCVNLGINHRTQSRIIRCAAATAAGHAKGNKLGIFHFWRLGKKRIIGRVCPWPASFDIINADIIKRMGNSNLIGARKIDAAGLPAIA